MEIERSSGILLHPTSLPGEFGIGDLGPEAHRWLKFLAAAECRWWQVLPLGPTGYGDSPYQSFSAFAGNPMLISPALLVEDGLLTARDLEDKPAFPVQRVDFAAVSTWKESLLARAYQAHSDQPEIEQQFARFRARQSWWLEDYGLFMALKVEQGAVAWTDWPEPLRLRQPHALQEAQSRLPAEITAFAFQQFLFFRQWQRLRARMAQLNLALIGDIPIYVAQDSADVWANPELFRLDKKGQPTAVSGVPPDYFSSTGQLWGNPLYRWERHAEQGYSWWLARLRATLEMVDLVRLDHFRGFAGYWAVPAGEPTAENGRWLDGPGVGFFQVLKDELGELPLIAEDLGEITPDVIALRDQFNLPGMKILQFAFDDGLEHKFLPHNYPANAVAYTGTHDNDTTRGWYARAPQSERAFCRQYLGVDGSAIAWDMIRAVWASPANLALAPMQDFLDLGTAARMNYPSSSQGNWNWRMAPDAANSQLAARIAELNRQHRRRNN